MQNAKELAAGTICIAGRSSTATKPNELVFEKGDLITLIAAATEDKKYCQATSADGSVGLIPLSSLLERPAVLLQPMPWFHGPITRFDAEKILDRYQEGQFLMRTSQSTQGVYALAVSHGGKVNHYLVAMDFSNRQITITGERYFRNLLNLVQYYEERGEDLGTCLRVPRIRRGQLEYFVDADTLKSKWGLSSSSLLISTESIGKGEFGEVVVGTYRGAQVAIKRVHESKQTGTPVTALLREAAVMTHLRHKNLVQLVGLVFKGSALQNIVMEVMGKGSLQKYLISRGRSVISQTELLSFSRDVCAGMEYVASQKFVHRDLATRNVLLNSNGEAKISDFGMARRTDIHVPHEGGKFPIKWTAPEALKDSKFSMKSDVWSYGVFLWEVFSYGRTPYPSIPADAVLENIEDGYIMDPPDNCPKGMYGIMCRCWRMEPRERPTFKSLGEMLPSTLESASRCPSPLPTSHTVTLPQIEELLRSSVAAEVYREAPLSQKANMFVTNLMFLGPLGSGKTSLLRSFLGQSFRLTEPSTLNLLFSDSYFSLVDHSNWSPSSAPLMYEDELVHIIIEELLKQAQHLLSAGQKFNESPRVPAEVEGADSDASPPIPSLASIQRRSQSFSDVHGTIHSSAHDMVATKASNRFSGSYEVMASETSEGKLQLRYGTDPDSDRGPPLPPERRHSGSRQTHRRNFISRFFAGKAKAKSGSSLQRHYSDSLKHSHYTGISQSNGNVSTTYFSSLPERLIHKIRSELTSLTDSSLPPKYSGKLVDMPGGRAFQALRSLFITDYSVCILVYDASKNLDSSVSPGPHRKLSTGLSEGKANGIVPGGVPHDTYFNHIMSEFNNLCLQWSHSEADMTVRGPRIILVGTHSDKVPSSVSHKNFDKLRRAIQSSPYQKYVAMMKYVLSSSSLIERANMDDLKRFTIEVVKKSCRQQVPLKWLRCIRRFFGLSSRGIYFISLEDARKIVVDMCDLSPEEHVDDVIGFLRNNQVILHFPGVHQLRTIVFTNPAWFAQQLGTLFGAAWTTELSPNTLPHVKTEVHLLRTRGIVSKHLLEHIWHNRFVLGCRGKLIAILHKMDLICCLGPNSQPTAPSLSPSSITQDVSGTTTSNAPTPLSVSSIIIPSVLTEPVPSHLSKLPAFMLEPLLFVFKNGFVPFGVFPRLIVRCIHSYPHCYTLYSNGALFKVDESTFLLVSEKKDNITISLHRSLPPLSASSASSLGHVPSDLNKVVSSYPVPPNLDTCMAIQMFLQAAISDIVQQWFPQVDYHLCIECKCTNSSSGAVEGGGGSGSAAHYIILSQTDDVLQRVSLDCENGSQVVIGPTLYSWFGEIPKPQSPTEDNADFITTADIAVVCQSLASSWPVLGQTLGFSRTELERVAVTSKTHVSAGRHMLEEWKTLYKNNATFFALLGALEIIQRRDIADDLVAERMCSGGIDL